MDFIEKAISSMRTLMTIWTAMMSLLITSTYGFGL